MVLEYLKNAKSKSTSFTIFKDLTSSEETKHLLITHDKVRVSLKNLQLSGKISVEKKFATGFYFIP